MTMRAALFHDHHDIRVTSIASPSPTPTSSTNGSTTNSNIHPTPTQVLIDIEWCGICGSDLHEYTSGPLVIPRPTQPHHSTGATLPVVMGHEFCGRVSDLPVTYSGHLRIGMPVMVDPRLNCRSCHRCEGGRENACLKWGFLGLSGNGGGLAERVAVEERMCYPLPDGVDLRNAALIEPLVVARHALRSAGIGDEWERVSVLVLGGGPVGVAVVLDLLGHGARKVLVSEPSEKRRGNLEGLGVGVDVVDPMKQDVVGECRRLAGPDGVDVVFDCAGIMPALQTGMEALRVQGTYVNVAGWEKPLVVPMISFHFKELNFRASMAYSDQDFADVVRDFAAGKFPHAEEMVTSRIHLEDVVEKGFEQLIHNKDHHVKILVTPKRELLDS